MGVLGRAWGGRPRVLRRSDQRRSRRGGRDDLGVGGRRLPGERPSVRAPFEGRPHGLGVPHDRPDLARARSTRRPRGARSRGGRRDDSRRPLRASDRRRHAARLDHARVLPERRDDRRAEHRRPGARARRVRAPRRVPVDRVAARRRQGARRRLPRRRSAEVPPRLGRPRILLLPPRARREGVADRDWVVCGPGYLRDGPHGLLACHDGLALSVGHAADSRDLRRHRRDGPDEGDRHRRDAGARPWAECAADRRPRRAAGNARHAKAARAARCAHVRQVERRDGTRGCARAGRDRHLGARLEPADLRARLQHR